MPSTYAQNKKSIYNYRAKNLEKYNDMCRRNQRKYDSWKRVQKLYFNILLPDLSQL